MVVQHQIQNVHALKLWDGQSLLTAPPPPEYLFASPALSLDPFGRSGCWPDQFPDVPPPPLPPQQPNKVVYLSDFCSMQKRFAVADPRSLSGATVVPGHCPRPSLSPVKQNNPGRVVVQVRYPRSLAEGDPENASGFVIRPPRLRSESISITDGRLSERNLKILIQIQSHHPENTSPSLPGMVWRTALSPTQGRRPAHCASYNSHLGINA